MGHWRTVSVAWTREIRPVRGSRYIFYGELAVVRQY
jgi:hypothetical protein